MQYPAVKYVGIRGSHIHNWRSARQPAILSSNAEGNWSWHVTILAKILKGLHKLMATVSRTQLKESGILGRVAHTLPSVSICVTLTDT